MHLFAVVYSTFPGGNVTKLKTDSKKKFLKKSDQYIHASSFISNIQTENSILPI